MRKKLSWDRIKRDPNFYGLSRTSVWRAKNRGWAWVGYHTRELRPASHTFLRYCSADGVALTESAAVKALLNCKAPGTFWADAIQEALLRYVELSGVHESGQINNLSAWCWSVAETAVKNFLSKEGYWRGYHRRCARLSQYETRLAA